LLGGRLRLWWAEDGVPTLIAGAPADDPGFRVRTDGSVESTGSDRFIAAVPESAGYYFECNGSQGAKNGTDYKRLGALLSLLLAAETDTLGVAEELAGRYEEIDLLYTISEILGRTIRLEEAAEVIVREVSSVVESRRASIFVHHPENNVLRPVAGWGIDVGEFGPIPVDHPDSIAARAFRESRSIAGSARDFDTAWRPPRRQSYRGTAFLSVPIIYPGADGVPRPVGVINLTDRLGSDSFSAGHRKLVEAIAHQIGAAIENVRLVSLDRQRQRVRRELELAHDLQLRLLPSPAILGQRVDVAAKCEPGEAVGGDFYNFVPLGGSEVGVMLGDVSTHGFPAALIMALVLSAAGIHAAAAESPERALDRLLESVRAELATTEMYLSVFYGVVDLERRLLRYANAGHPHAFLIPPTGDPVRLEATTPPLGLSEGGPMRGIQHELGPGEHLLVLFSDGIAETTLGGGVEFGERRVLDLVQKHRSAPTQEIVDAVFESVAQFGYLTGDDQALLVLKI
jgi:phosphoserine phosphatase RsbU/P